jgi:hypothetical protein
MFYGEYVEKDRGGREGGLGMRPTYVYECVLGCAGYMHVVSVHTDNGDGIAELPL